MCHASGSGLVALSIQHARPKCGKKALAQLDMSFADQSLSAEFVAKEYKNLENQVYVVPREIDSEVGRLKLVAMGIEIDELTAEQEKYLNSWNIGT